VWKVAVGHEVGATGDVRAAGDVPGAGGIPLAGCIPAADGVTKAGGMPVAGGFRGPPGGVADECLRHYMDWLWRAVRHQQGPVLQAERLVDNMIAMALRMSDGTFNASFRTVRFGSRLYDVVLPSSDLDLVVKLPDSGYPCVTDFLLFIWVLINATAGCTYQNNGIDEVSTVSFCYAGLSVSVTAISGLAHQQHRPLRTSLVVARALDRLPPAARLIACLMVDWAKSIARVCWDRKGRVTGNLKTVHWVLLTIAWWRQTSPAETLPVSTLFQMLSSFLAFGIDVAFWKIRAVGDNDVFGKRTDTGNGASPMWLRDPLAEHRNLATLIDPIQFDRIKAALATCCQNLRDSDWVSVTWMQSHRRWCRHWTLQPALLHLPLLPKLPP